jgi:lysophospholipase L1-like esterase
MVYVVTDYFFARSFNQAIHSGYHPYLQLKPKEFVDRGWSGNTGHYMIVCLGGSTTEFPDSQGVDWPSRLEKLLNTNGNNVRYEVYNQGRQWYTTLHSLINYEVNIRQYRPNMVIVMHMINDLLHNADFSYFSFGKFRDDYGHFYGPLYRLMNRTNIVSKFFKTFHAIWYFRGREEITTDFFPWLIIFERNLNSIIDIAQLDGAQVVLMTEPFLVKERITANERNALIMLNVEAIGRDKRWSLETALNGMRKYNEKIREVAKSRGVYLIDLEKDIPKTLEYFKDDVHFTDKTFDIVAENIAKEASKILFR